MDRDAEGGSQQPDGIIATQARIHHATDLYWLQKSPQNALQNAGSSVRERVGHAQTLGRAGRVNCRRARFGLRTATCRFALAIEQQIRTTYQHVVDQRHRTIKLATKTDRGRGKMSKNTDADGRGEKADEWHGAEQKPGDWSDHPPLWSPWNFQNKKSDWHEAFYDEIPSSKSGALK
jgi:hypothetical protein